MIAILLTIFGFGALIFVHEFGHFISAKFVGIRVEKFALGFGPNIVSFKWGETTYAICWIPFGGYVKMSGQSDVPGEEVNTGDPREYCNKKIWERMLVVVAGVTMNAIFAFFILLGLYWHGYENVSNKVGHIEYQNHINGIRKGDVIVEIDGETVRSYEELQPKILLKDPGTESEIKVIRDGKEVTLKAKIFENDQGLGMLGVQYSTLLTISNLSEIPSDENNPELKDYLEKIKKLRDAGLKDNMLITKINDTKLQSNDVELFKSIMIKNPGKEITLEVYDEKDVKYDNYNYKPIENAKPQTITLKCEATNIIGPGFSRAIVIQDVLEGSPADKMGLKKFDKIVNFIIPDENKTISADKGFSHFNSLIIQNGEKDLQFEIERKENNQTKIITSGIAKPYKLYEGKYVVGITMGYDNVVQNIYGNIKGVNKGDTITKVAIIDKNGERTEYDDASQAPLLYPDIPKDQIKEYEVVLNNSGTPIKLTPQAIPDFQLGSLGLAFTQEMVVVKGNGFLDSIAISLDQCRTVINMSYLAIYKLLNGSLKPDKIGGPVMIIYATHKTAQRGLSKYFWWIAFISMSLAFFNLLPIPILDGGLAVMLVLEKIMGKPLNPKIQLAIAKLGFAMIIILVVYVTFNDISKIFFEKIFG